MLLEGCGLLLLACKNELTRDIELQTDLKGLSKLCKICVSIHVSVKLHIKCVSHAQCGRLERPTNTHEDLYYIIITIVQSYTGKYHEFVAICIVTSAQHK